MSIEEAVVTRRGGLAGKLIDVGSAVVITLLELIIGIAYAYIASAAKLPSVYAVLALGYTLSSFIALVAWVYSLKFSPRALAGKSPQEIWGFLGEVFSTLHRFHRQKKYIVLFSLLFLVVVPTLVYLFYPTYPAVSGFLAFVIIGVILFTLGVFVVFRHVLQFFTIIHKMYEILQLSIAILSLELAVLDHYINIVILSIIMIILSAISLAAAIKRHKILIEATVPPI